MPALAKPYERGVADKVSIVRRLYDAFRTMRSMPGDGPHGFYTAWPAYRLDWWDEGNELSKRSDADIARRFLAPPRFQPSPAQIDDFEPAMRLLDGVDRLDRRIVSARSWQLWYRDQGMWLKGGWRHIGARAGISHTAAQKIHDRTISRAVDRFLELGGL